MKRPTEPTTLKPVEPTNVEITSSIHAMGVDPAREGGPVIRANSIILGGGRKGAMRVVFFTNPAHGARPAPHIKMRREAS